MQRTILITGATSGLGAALAELYARSGVRVLRVGRRAALGEDYCRTDLANLDCVAQVERFLRNAGIEVIDQVVHNAGTGYFGPPELHRRADLDALFAVNFEAPAALTRALWPRLQRAAEPKIAFISSVAGSLPAPQYAAYAASKAALNGFARSIAVELTGQAAVQLIVAGAINSGMHAKMGIKKSDMDWDRFSSVASAAQKVKRALDGGPGVKTIGACNRLLRGAGRYLPGLLDIAAAFKARGRPFWTETPRTATGGIAIVTGAARGIGKAISHRLARAGFRVVGVDRDREELEAVAGMFAREGLALTILPADLTQDAGLDAVVAHARRLGAVDAVVHNAGISWVGRFEDCPQEALRRLVRLNLRAPAAVTNALLAENLVRENGAFVFVSSLSNFTGYPGAAVYAATKEGIASFARSLRAGICRRHHVMTVYPGPTRTDHARRYSPDNSKETRRMSPERVADAVFRGLETGAATVVPGWGNRMFGALGLITPSLMDRVMKMTLFDKIVAMKLGDSAPAKP